MNTYAFRKRSIENYTLKRDRKRVEDAMKKRKQSFLKRNCVDVESILHNATKKTRANKKTSRLAKATRAGIIDIIILLYHLFYNG